MPKLSPEPEPNVRQPEDAISRRSVALKRPDYRGTIMQARVLYATLGSKRFGDR